MLQRNLPEEVKSRRKSEYKEWKKKVNELIGAVQTEHAGRDNQIGALKSGIPECRFLSIRGIG